MGSFADWNREEPKNTPLGLSMTTESDGIAAAIKRTLLISQPSNVLFDPKVDNPVSRRFGQTMSRVRRRPVSILTVRWKFGFGRNAALAAKK
jgi:hypothetical protein